VNLDFSIATEGDALALKALHNAVSGAFLRSYRSGPWSVTTETDMLLLIRNSRCIVAWSFWSIVGTLHLRTTKPWPVHIPYFTRVKKALYLTDMAVFPTKQRQGIGRMLLEEAVKQARAWSADAIRVDAFAAAAGASGFYAKCGFREVCRVRYSRGWMVYFELVL
jgi:GNAT superfamily N-acetyltransferase